MIDNNQWGCPHCGETNAVEVLIGTIGLTPDQLDEMDPEDIENWQDANAPVQCCAGCGKTRN